MPLDQTDDYLPFDATDVESFEARCSHDPILADLEAADRIFTGDRFIRGTLLCNDRFCARGALFRVATGWTRRGKAPWGHPRFVAADEMLTRAARKLYPGMRSVATVNNVYGFKAAKACFAEAIAVRRAELKEMHHAI